MTTIRVEGIKETLKVLKDIDPDLRREFTRNAKQITQPIVNAAQSIYRSTTFPSGTARRWAPRGREIFPLTQQKTVRGVSTKISTSRRTTGAITVVQSNPGGAVFEFAKNGRLGQALTFKNGMTPRAMWRAADANLETVQSEMSKLVDDVADTVNRRLY